MKRRVFLSAATLPLAATAVSATDGPIATLHKKYQQEDAYCVHAYERGVCNCPLLDQAYASSWDCTHSICRHTPSSMAELTSQLKHLRERFMAESNWTGDLDIKLIDNAIAGAEAMT